MSDQMLSSLAALVLRLTTGTAFIAHGLLKLLVFTPAGTAGFFQSLGYPAELAYLVIAGEILGGAALILGVYTRAVSLALIPLMIGATAVHLPAGWLFSNDGGGWEFPAFWTAILGAQALLGNGAYALGNVLRPTARPELA